MMNAMMRETLTSGTARKADLPGWPAAGKTGTSQDFRDAWFVGYTSQLVTGVWFGNDDFSPTRKATGGGLPVEAWSRFMKAAHQGISVTDLPGSAASPAAIASTGFSPGVVSAAPPPAAATGPGRAGEPVRPAEGTIDGWLMNRLFPGRSSRARRADAAGEIPHHRRQASRSRHRDRERPRRRPQGVPDHGAHDRGRRLLDHAAERGGRAGMMGKRLQRRREGLRHDQAHAGEIDRDRHREAQARPRQEPDRCDQSEAAGGHRDRADADGAIESEAHDDSRRKRRPQHESDRREAERNAEGERRQAVKVLQHEWRRGNPGEQPAEADRRQRDVGEEAAVREQQAVTEQHIRERQRRGRRLAGFRQQPPRQRGGHPAGRKNEDEIGAPPEHGLQGAADQRADDRRQSHDHGHDRQFAAGTRTFIEVADDRARQHNGTRCAEPLDHPRGDQRPDPRRDRTGEGRQAKDDERRHQDRLAPVAVRHRPVHDLAAGKSDQIDRDRELHLRRRGVEQLADLRHRRKIEIDRQWADGRHQRQQYGQGERAGTQHQELIEGGADAAECRPGNGRWGEGLRRPGGITRRRRPPDRAWLSCRKRRVRGRSDADRCHGRRARPWRAPCRDTCGAAARQNRGEWFISTRWATSWAAR